MFRFVSRKRKTRDDEDLDSGSESHDSIPDDRSSNDDDSESSVDSDSEEGSDAGEEDGSGLGGALTAESVLNQPLIQDPSNENVTLCLICSRKTLKNDIMIEVHEKSNSHQRRLKRFAKCAKDLERESGKTPSVPNILAKLENETAVITPKTRPQPRERTKKSITIPTPSTDDINPSTSTSTSTSISNPTEPPPPPPPKPRPSRRERKKARQAKREKAQERKEASTSTSTSAFVPASSESPLNLEAEPEPTEVKPISKEGKKRRKDPQSQAKLKSKLKSRTEVEVEDQVPIAVHASDPGVGTMGAEIRADGKMESEERDAISTTLSKKKSLRSKDDRLNPLKKKAKVVAGDVVEKSDEADTREVKRKKEKLKGR